MKYQIEFEGRKLGQTECGSYSEARSLMYRITRQCIETYRKIRATTKINQARENILQIRIIAKLKIRPIANSAQLERPQGLPQISERISQIHRSYADVE